MFSPLALVSFLRWTLFALMIAVSVFINRWLGFSLLLALVAWEMSARYFAPYFLIKKLGKRRLRNQALRLSMTDSLWSDYPGETKLLELSADWPVVMVIQQRKPTLFFNPILAEKLQPKELTLIHDWTYLLFQRKVSFSGLQLILLLMPFTLIFKIMDKIGLSSSKAGSFNWERSFHKLLSPILYPFFEEHRICMELLCERHGYTQVNRLRDKLNHLIKAHDEWPPADMAYLTLDPQYIFKKKSFYYFNLQSNKTLKEPL